MQISKELMDAFYAKEREVLSAADGDFEVSMAWSLCESTVNNIHHGQDPRVWIPRFIELTESRIPDEQNAAVVAAYREAIELAQVALPD